MYRDSYVRYFIAAPTATVFALISGLAFAQAAHSDDGWSVGAPYLLAQAGAGDPEKGAQSATSQRFGVRLTGGYDDNPLRLNPTVLTAPNSAPASALGRLRLDYRLEHRASSTFRVFADARLRARKHAGGGDAADRNDLHVTVGVTDRSMRLAAGPLRLTIGGTFGRRDLTFIDNRTGLAAAGLENRFDAIWYEAFVRLRAPMSNRTMLRLDFDARAQDYTEDFVDLGLEPLDYTQFDIKPGVQRRAGDGTIVRLTGHYGFRIYSARRADDLTGTPIDGTTLNYHFFGAKVNVRKNLSESLRIDLGGDIERRVDSEVGFNNRTTFEAVGRMSYDLTLRNRLSASLAYKYREYDHLDGNSVSNTNDGGRKRQGYRLFLTYLARKVVMGADAFVRYQRDSFTNSDLFYEYDRNVYTAGVRARF